MLRQNNKEAAIMESQVELNEQRKQLLAKLGQALPALMRAEGSVLDEVYRDGALSAKVKRLMSLAIALRAGCTNCILAQTEKAVDEGATKDEILEALQVLVAMGGTTGIAESLRVIKFLDELGHL